MHKAGPEERIRLETTSSVDVTMKSEESLRLRPTSSVDAAMKQVGLQKPISASAFATAIIKLHPEYAGGNVESILLKDTPSTRTAQEWIDEIQTLFDVEKILDYEKRRSASSQSEYHYENPMLHGRLAIIGLCLLEYELRKQLDGGMFNMLEKELREPLPKILTERGHQLYPSPDVLESVPNWPDDPLLHPDQDLLGRMAFARFLAKRIAAIPPESGAYSLHVYGPWGAGKSSLLNFLRKCLESETEESEQPQLKKINGWLWSSMLGCTSISNLPGGR